MIRASLFGLITALAVACAIACTSLAGSDAGTCTAPSAGAAGCLLPLLATSVKAKQPWSDALAAAAKTCGTTSETASTVWASHTQAEVLEGFVPLAVGGEGGISP